MKECYDFKPMFDAPVKLRKIWFFTIPTGISLARVVSILVIVGLMYLLFNGVLLFLDSILHGIRLVAFLYVPYKLSGWLLDARTDGQRLSRYFLDLMSFVFLILIPKRSFCQDEGVHLSNTIIFEEVTDE